MDQTARMKSLPKVVFAAATPEYQALIREILKEEREVQHLKRRPDIHTKIYEHVRRIIK